MLSIAMRRRAARKTDADEESLIDFRRRRQPQRRLLPR